MRGRPRSSDRLWVEHCAVLDIKQCNLPDPAASDDPWWRFLYPEQTDRLMSVDITATWRDGRETFQTIGFAESYPYFGGRRYWFSCPRCGRRAGKLYATEDWRNYTCRLCLGLVYKCQYRKTSAFWKLLRRYARELWT